MTGAALKIGVDEAGAVALSDLRAAFTGAGRETLLHGIGAALVSLTQSRFDAGKDPDGKAWKQPVHGGRPLRGRGHLYDSITHIVNGDELRVGSNLKYAAIHQFGGVIEPKNKQALAFQIGGETVVVRRVTIPARPYLGLGADGEAAVRDAVADRLDAAASKGAG